MSEPLRNVGWGPIPLPGERKRQETIGTRIHEAAEKALEPLTPESPTESFVLIVSNGWGKRRAEGPMTEHQAMARRNYIFDNYEGLSVEMVLAEKWDES